MSKDHQRIVRLESQAGVSKQVVAFQFTPLRRHNQPKLSGATIQPPSSKRVSARIMICARTVFGQLKENFEICLKSKLRWESFLQIAGRKREILEKSLKGTF